MYLPNLFLFTYQIPPAMEDVARENMDGLATAFLSSSSVSDFLTDPEILIPLQASTVDNAGE